MGKGHYAWLGLVRWYGATSRDAVGILTEYDKR